MFKISYDINNHKTIKCGNNNCKSINCIVRYDYFDEEDKELDLLREFYVCLDCGKSELVNWNF